MRLSATAPARVRHELESRDGLRLAISNELDELARVSTAASELLERHGVAEEAAYATHLVLEELLSNVIRHAFPEGGRHEIELSLQVDADGIELCIEDDGRAFDPLQAPPPRLDVPLEEREVGGLGIHLVRVYASELRYARRAGRNVVRLRV